MQQFSGKKTTTFLSLSILFIFTLIAIAPLPAAELPSDSITALRQIGKAFASVSEKASPAVVSIRAEKVVTQQYLTMPDWPFGDPFGDDFFDRFFQRQMPRSQPRQRKILQPAQGSGFIISNDGYILTNNHLVGEAEKVWVKIGDSPEIKADVIGTDPDTDVAVIKIKKNNLPYLELADSDKLEVGEWVLAIGNPFGLSHTVTAGIVSAKGRSAGINKYEDFIQTDAAINPGNSGGPLINLDSKVVGINAAIIGPGGNIGIGFAIPINIAKSVYKQLITTGKVVRGYLGVNVQDLTESMADSLGLKGKKGAIIPKVEENSPAAKAGIQPGDIIIQFDEKPIENSKDLVNMVGEGKPGQKVSVIVIRDGQNKTLEATLGEAKPQKEQEQESVNKEPLPSETIGISVQNLTSDIAEQLGFEGLSGVIISQVDRGSAADQQGLSAGTLIMEVNQKKIKNVSEFNAEIKKVKKGGNILLLVQDDNGRRFVALTIPED